MTVYTLKVLIKANYDTVYLSLPVVENAPQRLSNHEITPPDYTHTD